MPLYSFFLHATWVLHAATSICPLHRTWFEWSSLGGNPALLCSERLCNIRSSIFSLQLSFLQIPSQSIGSDFFILLVGLALSGVCNDGWTCCALCIIYIYIIVLIYIYIYVYPPKSLPFKVHLLGLGVPYINTYAICKYTLKKRLEIDTRTQLRYSNCEVQTWCSDLRFRLDVQTWSSDLMFRLEFRLGNLQFRIEDWRLKILQDSSWRIFSPSPRLRIQYERFSPGLKIPQQESWRIFNLQSWTEDSPRRVLENLQSSIFNPGLQDPGSIPGCNTRRTGGPLPHPCS